MMNANKISHLVLLLTFISCNNKESKNVAIDCQTDDITYKLDILEKYPDEKYYIDKKGRSTLLLSNKVFNSKTCFGGIENIPKAIKYAKTHSDEKGANNIRIVTEISIKNNNNVFENIWIWENPINLNKDGYSFREGRIELENGYVKYRGEYKNCLKIVFKQPDNGDGFKMYILNFIKENELWKLVSREKINTILNDINHDKVGYCKDTINSNCKINEKNSIFITDEYMFNLNNAKCY